MNQEKNQMTKSFFSPAFLRPVLLLFLVLYFGLQVVRVLKSPQNPNLAPGGSSCADRLPPTPVLRGRHHIGAELERLNFTTGAELGVQAGLFAHETLKSWPRCQLYILVDVWSQQTNYKDQANVDNSAQEGLYQETMKRLEPFKEKLRVFRMFTSEAAKKIPDESLDYIYVDARHDYCGAKEDIELYWPKLRKGGLMAGHDYLVAEEVPGQDWAICQDGSRHPGAVKGAVDEFAAKNKLQVTVTYQENMFPNTWFEYLVEKTVEQKWEIGNSRSASASLIAKMPLLNGSGLPLWAVYPVGGVNDLKFEFELESK